MLLDLTTKGSVINAFTSKIKIKAIKNAFIQPDFEDPDFFFTGDFFFCVAKIRDLKKIHQVLPDVFYITSINI